jgi:hypothetical protein
MNKPLWKSGGRIVGALVLAAVAAAILLSGFSNEHYSGICTRCVQQVDGVDKFFYGIRYYHHEVLTSGNGDDLMSPAIFGPRIGQTEASAYEQIFGKPCEHHIVRTGFCQESFDLFSIAYGDGVHPRPPGIDDRLFLIKALFGAFRRVPDKELARASYAMIDQAYPESLSWENRPPPSVGATFVAGSMPDDPMSILFRGLKLVQSSDEWRAVLDAAKARNGTIPLLKVGKGQAGD